MILALPDPRFRDSFLELARDLRSQGHWYDGDPEELARDLAAYLRRLEDWRHGRSLRQEQVPCTEYWMVAGEEVVGRLRLNHRLSDALRVRGGHIGYGVGTRHRGRGYATEALRQALVEASKLGLTEVLVTCDEDNAPSIRVIEKNGGVLQDTVLAPGRNVLTRRYRVGLSAQV